MASIAYEEGGDQKPLTLYDKIWRDHLVDITDGQSLIFIDRHLVHEVTSPQAFEGLRMANRRVRRPDCTLATVDHNIPTESRQVKTGVLDIKTFIKEKDSLNQVATLEENVQAFGLQYFGMDDKRQGIVHVIGPEQGFTLPGTTVVCGDSHTSTHGAFGSLAFGIGTSEVEHVLATQTLIMNQSKNMRVSCSGKLTDGVTSKDVILHIIGITGTAGGNGYVIEFCGSVMEAMSMEARMCMCNMTIEGGARAGMVAPDDVTFEYLKGRPLSPKGSAWEKAVEYWRSLRADPGAVYDKDIFIDGADIAPTVTWGTSPEDVVPITGCCPDPAKVDDPTKKSGMIRAMEYMGLTAGVPMEDLKVDKVFIGSCTNSRIEDLRSAAAVARGRKVADGVYAMVVPGSGVVKEQAEVEGLHEVFREAGFDWREPGCSMCLGMNPDRLTPGERCASTSNRNFEGRQGPGGRTHLMSPAMAAAAAVTGYLKDVRELLGAKKADLAKCSKKKAVTSSKDFVKEGYTLPAPDVQEDEKKGAAAAGGGAGGMAKFITLDKEIAAPLPRANIDTDMIIPKQFLKTIKRTGLGTAAFFELRYEDDGVTEIPSFVLNKPEYRQSKILITGENFGCGSSREHAPWAIGDFGIRCIIAASFADIFNSNCFKNSILPVALPQDKVEILMKDAEACKKLTVDLPQQKVFRENGEFFTFEVDQFRKHCLINGLDDIGLTLMKKDKIMLFEDKRADIYSWLEKATSLHQRKGAPAEVRVTSTKAASFYANTAKGFLTGLAATENLPARPPASKVTLTATGGAVDRAVRAATELEESGDGIITSVRTDFVEPENGNAHLPMITLVIEPTPKAQAIAVAWKNEKAGCGCKTTEKKEDTPALPALPGGLPRMSDVPAQTVSMKSSYKLLQKEQIDAKNVATEF